MNTSEREEKIKKIYDNPENRVSLSLSDFNAIQEILKDNEQLEKEKLSLADRLKKIYGILIQSNVDSAFLDSVLDGTAEVSSSYIEDEIKNTQILLIRITKGR